MPNNADRAERAEQAIEHYCEVLGGGDEEEVLIDLFTDLMHRYGKTAVTSCCRIAKTHYQEEKAEEAEERLTNGN